MKKLTGTGVAMVTPFLADGGIDYEALKRLTLHLIEGGVNYLVVLGTTGENVTLSEPEQIEVIRTVMDTNAGRLPVVLGVGGNDTRAVSAKMIAYAERFSPDAFLSSSPSYNKPTQAGIVAHYQAISAVTKVPVVLYNVPGRTASNMLSSTTLTIAASCPSVVAIKEASGNLEQGMELVAGAKDDFLVLSGDDILTLPMISTGFKGLISVIANAYPRETSDMVRLALSGDYDGAKSLHYKLLKLMQLIFAEGNPAGVKALLELRGICGPHVRLPLVPASADLRDRIQAAMW